MDSLHGLLNWIYTVVCILIGLITSVASTFTNLIKKTFYTNICNIFTIVGMGNVAKQLENGGTNIDLEKIKPSGNTIETYVTKLGEVISCILSLDFNYDVEIVKQFHGLKYVAIKTSEIAAVVMKCNITKSQYDSIFATGRTLFNFVYSFLPQ